MFAYMCVVKLWLVATLWLGSKYPFLCLGAAIRQLIIIIHRGLYQKGPAMVKFLIDKISP